MLTIPNIQQERCPGHSEPYNCPVCLRNEMRVLIAANQTLREVQKLADDITRKALVLLTEAPGMDDPNHSNKSTCICHVCIWVRRVTEFLKNDYLQSTESGGLITKP